MAKVFLRKGAHKRVEAGHPWVYQSEVDGIEGEFKPGDTVEVVNFRGKFLGRGYINPRSQMIVRILTRCQDEKIDRAFFYRRISDALAYRQRFLPGVTSFRAVFGEADFLPALIVDKFEQYLVVQILALGMEVHKETIVDVLNEIFRPAGIYERSDVTVRELEGLEPHKGFLLGEFDPLVQIQENGLKFWVDIANGQKTGYFFDQRENRLAIKEVVRGARVLDCFCHTGSFAVHAARFGAQKVVSVDISEPAVEMARKNCSLNGYDHVCEFKVANAFDELRSLTEQGAVFDTVILDPPAFTKSREAIEGAVRGYKEINLRAMKLLPERGYLVTCSCSYHMDRELFLAILADAAKDAKRNLRLVEYRTQAKDHPVLPVAPETNYLKFAICEIS